MVGFLFDLSTDQENNGSNYRVKSEALVARIGLEVANGL
jgi:hypothetical protein